MEGEMTVMNLEKLEVWARAGEKEFPSPVILSVKNLSLTSSIAQTKTPSINYPPLPILLFTLSHSL
jgi:hypothetical protein